MPGNNDGTFQAPVQILADPYPASVAVADLNGDGNSDLILGDAVNGTLTILMGKGDGTFQKPATVTLASGVVAALAVGDFNADKNADVVAAVLSGPVFILSGKGDGSFQTPVQIATAATSPHLVVGNFDADGKLDLVVRSETPRPSPCRRPPCIAFDRVQVLGGNGDGTFNPPTLLSILNPSVGNLAAGDFNADGKLDLILSRSGSGLPYLGRNNDTFLAHPALWTGLGAFVIAADLNGDGLSDLAVTDSANNNVVVFLNTSPTAGADLSVTEPATANAVIGGDDLTYRATVLNAGPHDATGVTLKEMLPASFNLVSTQPSQGTCSGTTTITCNLGAMPEPSSATVDFTVKPTAGGIFTDGLHVTATEPDLNTKNNSASTTITAVLPADLAVSGTASKTIATIGDNVTFNIRVTNHGPATATNITLTDSLSDGLAVTSLTVSQGSCSPPITCSIGTLKSGASATLSFVITMANPEIFVNNLGVGSDQPDLVGDTIVRRSRLRSTLRTSKSRRPLRR